MTVLDENYTNFKSKSSIAKSKKYSILDNSKGLFRSHRENTIVSKKKKKKNQIVKRQD